jgi:hypothetical protein
MVEYASQTRTVPETKKFKKSRERPPGALS